MPDYCLGVPPPGEAGWPLCPWIEQAFILDGRTRREKHENTSVGGPLSEAPGRPLIMRCLFK